MFARLVRMARRGTPEIDTVLATPGLLLALEPRYVFDAGAVATAAEAAGAETNAAYDGPAEATDAADAPQPGDVAVAGEAPGEGRAREIVFIDARLEGRDGLVAGVAAGAEVVLIEPGSNGVARITEVLAHRSDLEAVHIVSHGEAGVLRLGEAVLSNATLPAYAGDLAAWGRALADGADLLIYGCDVAAGPAGEAFVREVAGLTGADVAASDDATGAARIGGDWVLEARTGAIEAALAFAPAAREALPILLGETVFVNADNENNALNGTADNDFGLNGGNGFTVNGVKGQTNEIEFNMFVTKVPTDTAFLSIRANDVDEELTAGGFEQFDVRFNGNLLGKLSGADGVTNSTTFQVPVGQIVAGKNLIQIDVKSAANPLLDANVQIKVLDATLLLDGGAGDRAVTTDIAISNVQLLDLSGPVGNDTAQFDVTSSVTITEGGNYRFEVNVIDPNGNNVGVASGNFVATAGQTTSVTVSPQYPLNSATGTYTIRALLFDADTNTQQDIDTATFIHTINQGPTALPPTNIALSSSTVPENSATGTVVGNLTATDPDVGNTHTFQLIGTSNEFEIVGNQLRVKAGASLNFESTTTSYTLRVQATDNDNLTYQRNLTVTVTDVNETPLTLDLSSFNVAENSAGGTAIGNLTSTDTDFANVETHTYSVVGGRTDLFQVAGSQLQVRTGADLNFEQTSSHSVTLRITDRGGLTLDRTFTVNVTDVNETPNNLALSNASVPENSPGGTLIGTLSSADTDVLTETPSSQHTYTAIGGRTDLFRVVGNQLQVQPGADLNFEAVTSHQITIRVTDRGGLTTDRTFTIAVTNVNETPLTETLTGTTTISEDSPPETVIGTLAATDTDNGDSHTFTAVGGRNDLFEVVGNTLRVRAGASLDVAVATPFDIVIRATDAGGLSIDRTFTITVQPVVAPPTDDVQQPIVSAPLAPLPPVAAPAPVTNTAGTVTPLLDLVRREETVLGIDPFDASFGGMQLGEIDLFLAAAPGETLIEPGRSTVFQIPPDTFEATGDQDLILEASLADGSPLPPWLRFDADSSSFNATPPVEMTGTVLIRIAARDLFGNQAEATMAIRFADPDAAVQEDEPVIEINTQPSARIQLPEPDPAQQADAAAADDAADPAAVPADAAAAGTAAPAPARQADAGQAGRASFSRQLEQVGEAGLRQRQAAFLIALADSRMS